MTFRLRARGALRALAATTRRRAAYALPNAILFRLLWMAAGSSPRYIYAYARGTCRLKPPVVYRRVARELLAVCSVPVLYRHDGGRFISSAGLLFFSSSPSVRLLHYWASPPPPNHPSTTLATAYVLYAAALPAAACDTSRTLP